MIPLRFIAIGLRRYSAMPDDRKAAAALILRNAIRLAAHELSPQDAARIALDTLTEDDRPRVRACS